MTEPRDEPSGFLLKDDRVLLFGGVNQSNGRIATAEVLECAGKIAPTVTVSGGPFTFDGQAHAAVVSAIGTDGTAVSGTFTVTYAPGGSAAPVSAGTYEVTVTFSSSNPGYADATATGTLTIAAAPLTVKANAATKFVGAPNPAFTASYSGFVNGDTPAVLSGSLGFTTPVTTTSPVGTYAVTPGGVSSPNYSIAFVPGTLTVTNNVCLLFDNTRSAKIGSTLPIKLQLCDAAGVNASALSIVVNATNLVQVSTAASSTVVDAGDANPDGNFRFDTSLAGYIFNLKTTGLSIGTWQLNFTANGDPAPHSVTFSVK
jgi:hypothetical protein